MQKQTPKTKEQARQYAIDWQQFASDTDISYGEILDWQFTKLAKQFDLTDEFKENGII